MAALAQARLFFLSGFFRKRPGPRLRSLMPDLEIVDTRRRSRCGNGAA
jgi:hypothetical protein